MPTGILGRCVDPPAPCATLLRRSGTNSTFLAHQRDRNHDPVPVAPPLGVAETIRMKPVEKRASIVAVPPANAPSETSVFDTVLSPLIANLRQRYGASVEDPLAGLRRTLQEMAISHPLVVEDFVTKLRGNVATPVSRDKPFEPRDPVASFLFNRWRNERQQR